MSSFIEIDSELSLACYSMWSHFFMSSILRSEKTGGNKCGFKDCSKIWKINFYLLNKLINVMIQSYRRQTLISFSRKKYLYQKDALAERIEAWCDPAKQSILSSSANRLAFCFSRQFKIISKPNFLCKWK